MLVLRATRTWAGAFLEASSRGNAHNTLTNSAATSTAFSWWTRMISCPSPVVLPHPHPPLPFTPVGEGGGGGRFSHPDILSVDTWIFNECKLGRVGFYFLWQQDNSLRLRGKWLVICTCDCWTQAEPRSCRKMLLYNPFCPLFSFPTAHPWIRGGGQQVGFCVCSQSQNSGTTNPVLFPTVGSLSPP